MDVTYIFHSCYILELTNNILIFDYYKGQIFDDLFKTNKNIFVFSSHSHYDHYNDRIFEWNDLSKNISYVLSYDIAKTNLKNTYYLNPNEELTINNVKISTFGSTDKGVSFLICIDDVCVFHAGDLNYWHWKDESTKEYIESSKLEFEKILQKISEKTSVNKIDVAMFPTDPRMGKDYFEGSQMFIDIFRPKIFFPMHFEVDKNQLKDFKESMNIKYKDTKVIVPAKVCQNFNLLKLL